MFGNPPAGGQGAVGFVATRPLYSIAAALLLALPQYSSAAAPATVKKAVGRVACRPLHSIATALLLSLPLWPIPTALAVAAAVAAGGNAEGSAEQVLGYPEGALARVLTLPAPAADAGSNIVAWRLSGPDAAQFRLLAGALRFVAPPDFETPRDANGDNIYQVTLHPAASGNAVPAKDPAPAGVATGMISTTIRVTDRNEPGRLLPSTGYPAMGETVLARLSDPDGIAGNIRWRWERSGGRDEWLAIPGADTAAYTPTAADTGHWLRVLAKYEDRLGGPRQHVALLPETVLGPTLAALTARTDHGGSSLHPPFAPNIQHYGIACDERDVLSMGFGLPEEAGAGSRDGRRQRHPAPSGPKVRRGGGRGRNQRCQHRAFRPHRRQHHLHHPLPAARTRGNPHLDSPRRTPAAGSPCRRHRIRSSGAGPKRRGAVSPKSRRRQLGLFPAAFWFWPGLALGARGTACWPNTAK